MVNILTNANFTRWVRKLIGQARGLYTPGLRVRGSPHPVSQADTLLADSIRAFLTQSEVLSADLETAALMVLCSSGESLAWMRIARFLAFGTFGLPILDFIKILCV